MPHRTQPAGPSMEREGTRGELLRHGPTGGDTHVDSIGDDDAHRALHELLVGAGHQPTAVPIASAQPVGAVRCCTAGRSGR
jgi:hypothetical protein